MCSSSLLSSAGWDDEIYSSLSGGVRNHRSLMMLHIPLLLLKYRSERGTNCSYYHFVLLAGQCSILVLSSLHLDFLFKWRKSVPFLYICTQSLFTETSALKCQLSSSNTAVVVHKLKEKHRMLLMQNSYWEYPIYSGKTAKCCVSWLQWCLQFLHWNGYVCSLTALMSEKQMLGRQKTPINLNFIS